MNNKNKKTMDGWVTHPPLHPHLHHPHPNPLPFQIWVVYFCIPNAFDREALVEELRSSVAFVPNASEFASLQRFLCGFAAASMSPHHDAPGDSIFCNLQGVVLDNVGVANEEGAFVQRTALLLSLLDRQGARSKGRREICSLGSIDASKGRRY